jgi:HSP20 family molecular chaperone IbpA
MTQLQTWAMDPFDIVWKNFMNSNSTFNTLQEKINYPVDIYETENGLRFELAVVGLTENDLSIQIEDNTLRIKHDKLEDNIPLEAYYQKGITKRSFDLAWKLSSKLDLAQSEAILDKGLLIINVPYGAENAPLKIEIKSIKQIKNK